VAPLTLRLVLAVAAGLTGGVAAAPAVLPAVHFCFACAAMVAVLAHARGWGQTSRGFVWTLVASAAWLAGAHAMDDALHTSLRARLDARYGGFAIDAPEGPRIDDVVVVEGRLRDDAAMGTAGVVLHLDVESVWMQGRKAPVRGGVSATVAGDRVRRRHLAWTRGRRIRAPMRLRRPSRYLDAGVPDFERALARRGVSLVGTVKSGLLVAVISKGARWEEWSARVRARVRTVLARYLSGGGSGAAVMATAVLIGDRTALDADLARRLQEAGTYHVLAISGGNVATLAGALLGLLALAGRRGRGATAVALVAIAAYGAIVQGGASVTRATGMAILYLVIRLIDQRTSPVNALALVTLGMLLADPIAIADVGLWLTGGATLAILLAAGSKGGARRSPVRVAGSLAAATLAAEAALLPVAARVFERVTVAGVALNFIAIPCMSVVQLGAMAVVGADAAGLPHLAGAAAQVVEWGVMGLVRSAGLVEQAPWLSWRVPAPPVAIVVVYYALLAGWRIASGPPRDTRLRELAARWCPVAAACVGLWTAVEPWSLIGSGADGRLHVTTIDVGQGDAVLVVGPDGHRLLVDTGGTTAESRFDVGDRVVGPALRARGVPRLDYLALTHRDPDHAGVAHAVLRDFGPAEVWDGVPVPGNALMAHVRAMAAQRGAAWRTLQRGDRLALGDVQVTVLHPPPPDWERVTVRNDDSLVLDVRFGDVSVLLTGDIGEETERTLLPLLRPAPLQILKVPHHGSATSSGAPFIAALSPRIVTIGVGRGNPYGHPVPAVVDRYLRAGAAIFRTDRDGQIDIVTDGHTASVTTFTGREWHASARE
jgi:competence protein ComEC